MGCEYSFLHSTANLTLYSRLQVICSLALIARLNRASWNSQDFD